MSSTEISENQSSGIQLKNPVDKPISDESLADYGKQLKFDDKYLKKANEVCKKVVEHLKNAPTKPERFSVSETHVCQNGVDDTGIDIVAFMKEGMDMNKVKNEVNEVLNKMGGQNVSTDDKGVMHFNVDNVKVNLGISTSKGNTPQEHRKAVFQQVVRMDKDGKLQKNQIEKVSVDLHDSMNEFWQKADQGTQDVEFEKNAKRLSRAWRRTALAPWSDWFSPLDAMLVMQHALDEEKRAGGARSMNKVMRRFFKEMANVENMAVTFPQSSLYDWNIVPQWVQNQRPLLLDPVNPWRNPFNEVQKNMLGEVRKQAEQALKVLDKQSASLKELFNVPPGAEQRPTGA